MKNRFPDTAPTARPWSDPVRAGRYQDAAERLAVGAQAAVVALTLAIACLPALAETSKSAPARPQGWLGIALDNDSTPTGQDAAASPEGVLVASVVADSPARRAGLRGRDRILAVDGRTVSSPSELMSLVKSSAPDGWLSFSVRRGARTMELRAFLQARPENTGSLKMLEGWIGVEAIELPADLRVFFGTPKDAGVMISRVVAGSPAEVAGLSLGDVVFEVDGEPIRSGRALVTAVARGGVENKLQVRLMRSGAEITVEPLVAARPEKEARSEGD